MPYQGRHLQTHGAIKNIYIQWISQKRKNSYPPSKIKARHERQHTALLDQTSYGSHTRRLFDNPKHEEPQNIPWLRPGQSCANCPLHWVNKVGSGLCEKAYNTCGLSAASMETLTIPSRDPSMRTLPSPKLDSRPISRLGPILHRQE